MSNLVTSWRTATVALMSATFPEAKVVAGVRAGVSRDEDRIAVFWQRTGIPANVNYARPQLAIRFFAQLPKASAKLREVERDDSPLEQAAWDISAALMPVRTTLVAGLYFELSDIVPNRADFSVGLDLIAYLVNPAAIPAT